ncbi:MAG: NosD domain-containing protein [Candidatus Thorarchaeota archaeon]
MKNWMKILTISVLCLMLSTLANTESFKTSTLQIDNSDLSTEFQPRISNSLIISVLETHDPIQITSDADFASQALAESWSGDGSETTPYTIENLNITGEEYAISIVNTSVHFAIRNCLLVATNDSYSSAALSCTVENGVVDSSEIVSAGYGVSVEYGDNWNINYSLIISNRRGISIKYSDQWSIQNNTIHAERGDGLYFYHSKGVIFESNRIVSRWVGIGASHIQDFVINNNTIQCTDPEEWRAVSITGNDTIVTNNIANRGYNFDSSHNLTIENNQFSQGWLLLYGNHIEHWNSHVIENNFVNGKRIQYLNGFHDLTFDISDKCQVILSDLTTCTIQGGNFVDQEFCVVGGFCHNLTIRTCIGSNTSNLIQLNYCDNSLITNNEIQDSLYGISIENCVNCEVNENTLIDCGWGLGVTESEYISLNQNSITGGVYSGIELRVRIENMVKKISVGCLIAGNDISYSSKGIGIYGSESGLVINNTIHHNMIGIEVGESAYRTILYNNSLWMNEIHNAYDEGNETEWDDGLSVGNAWGDYDGVSYYSVPGDGGVDRFPRAIDTTTPRTTSTTTPINDSFQPLIIVVIVIAVISIIVVLIVVLRYRKK